MDELHSVYLAFSYPLSKKISKRQDSVNTSYGRYTMNVNYFEKRFLPMNSSGLRDTILKSKSALFTMFKTNQMKIKKIHSGCIHQLASKII